MLDQTQTDRIAEILESAEAELAGNIRAQREASRKAIAPRLFFLLVGLLALTNLYFVSQLILETRAIVSNMNEMYAHFATVSDRMSDIRDDMTRMEQAVRLVPVMTEQIDALGAEVMRMNRDMDAMTTSLGEMDGRVGAIDSAVADMTNRFRLLNQRVGQMSLDVNQMARPIP